MRAPRPNAKVRLWRYTLETMNLSCGPRLRGDLRFDLDDQNNVFLRSERQSTVLNHPLYAQLIPLVAGGQSEAEIVKHLANQIPAAYIHYGLAQLKQQGYLCNDVATDGETAQESVLPAPLAIASHHLKVAPAIARQRLQTTPVAVHALGTVTAAALLPLLAQHQIQVVPPLDTTPAAANTDVPVQPALDIVLCDDYLQPELDVWNQTALDQSRPWLLAKPVGTLLWLGPLFVPGQTACWACLAQRLRCNRPEETYLERHTEAVLPLTPPLAQLPAGVQIALGQIAMAVFKWIVQDRVNRDVSDRLLTYDLLNLASQRHTVVRRPQCPSCGQRQRALSSQPLPLILGHRPKKFTTDGGHRCQPPEVLLAQYQHHISPITGVVRSLEKHPQSLDGLQQAYVAQHHFRSMLDDLRGLMENRGGRSGGKGRTAAQAKMSAVGEAIERYSGVFQGDEPRIRRTQVDLAAELGAEAVIDPNHCMNFSPTQYAQRADWNRRCEKLFQRVPAPFDPQRERDWTPVWSLSDSRFKYLPSEYCYFGYPKPSQPDCWADTNGCAAGSTLEEAILQGLLELVERDSVALWWYNRLAKPAVDLASFDDPYFLEIQAFYQSLQRQIWVLDVTSDLGIPSFVAISACGDRPTEDIILGFGAHLDAPLAISRALTEVNQILPAVLPRNTDGTTRYAPAAETFTRDWWQTATLANQPYLCPATDATPKVVSDYPPQWSHDLLNDIHAIRAILEQQGLELLILDQTRPDIGLKVVKVIVPGLRHYWKRLGLGRLYDVPVQMGWRSTPSAESELNPLPMPL
ncbi:MAG: TOMM precursor leader peptide-binding protein [Cyanobacteria bacterium P01_G01_bin.54]